MPYDQKKLAYTIKEFMALAGVGRSFVYEAIAEGHLKAVKAGRKTLIREEDARAWLDALPAMKVHFSRAFERRQAATTSPHDSTPKDKTAREVHQRHRKLRQPGGSARRLSRRRSRQQLQQLAAGEAAIHRILSCGCGASPSPDPDGPIPHRVETWNANTRARSVEMTVAGIS